MFRMFTCRVAASQSYPVIGMLRSLLQNDERDVASSRLASFERISLQLSSATKSNMQENALCLLLRSSHLTQNRHAID